MRHDPSYLLWKVHCTTPATMRTALQQFPPEISLDEVFVNEVRAGPAGEDLIRQEPHRLGDYFENVRVLSATDPEAAWFRVLFHRRPNAGRFWKDFMVRILQSIRGVAGDAATTLEYSGDEEPEVAAPSQ